MERKMYMRFGTSVRSSYRAGSLKTTESEMSVQEVRWDEFDGQPADICKFLRGNGNANH
jgi:hypothetical protein